ncbi:MAG TPA: CheR family methyltransferase [Myxococcota bacterium]|nr:CheR family methyltransferase [Myxococcota bacterium]HRY95667.1 CheR family methyltransferase [Myxococcota bacterium]HSA21279.1 CheR family methyltransferase [Myxococcota bacterium]
MSAVPSALLRPTLVELDAGPAQAELIQLVARVKQHAGLLPDAGGLATMRRAVRQRMLRLGLTQSSDYLVRLRDVRDGEAELAELVALLVVQKTSFFRDRQQYELLRDRVLPELSACGRRVHLWSAGCATGEEAYSLAISLRLAGFSEVEAGVLATDIARQSLDRAAGACYDAERLEVLTPDERRYFHERPDGAWEAAQALRQMIQFRVHNLLSLPFPTPESGGWDVIFCRNVLIYFDRDTVREIIGRMHSVLVPGGFLFLGSCESLFQMSEGFELVSSTDAFVYRRGLAAAQRPAPVPLPLPVAPPVAPPARPRPAPDRAGRPDVGRPVAAPPVAPAALPPLPAPPPPAPQVDERLTRALAAADHGGVEEARGWLEAYLDERPMDPRAHFLRGVLQYRLGNDLEALTSLRRLVYLEAGFAMGHFYLGLVQERLGERELARRAFRNARDAAAKGQTTLQDPVLDAFLLPSDALAEACRGRLAELGGDRP